MIPEKLLRDIDKELFEAVQLAVKLNVPLYIKGRGGYKVNPEIMKEMSKKKTK